MCIRQVWVMNLSVPDKGMLLFNRAYPTVENQAKVYDGVHYQAPPSADEFMQAFKCAVGRTAVQEAEHYSREDQTPVCEVNLNSGNLWPVVFIEQSGVVFSCLPVVKQGSNTRPPLVAIDSISAGLTLLEAVAEFLGPHVRSMEKSNPKFAELYVYLGQVAPFGSPTETVSSRLKSLTSSRKIAYQPGQKQPAWKPSHFKGKAALHFDIKETIRAVQYDRKGVPDVWDVCGTVTCRAELEGMSPEVTLTLDHSDSVSWTPLDNLLFHPCVQSFQTQHAALPGTTKKSKGIESCRMRIMPPLESFTLCSYTANHTKELPFDGFYQMKGEETVQLLVQLKLNDKVRNSFDFCELQIPFFHRGLIMHYEAHASHGSVVLAPDKKLLAWSLGQKFPTKTLEVMLKASVYFSKYEEVTGASNRFEDQFCVGLNSYAQLVFKMSDFTMSGACIDAKSIQISPSTKFKCSMTREFSCGDYKIWNSHGDAPMAYTPSYEDLQLLHAVNSSRTIEKRPS